MQIGTPGALVLAMGLLHWVHMEYVMEGGGTMGEGGEMTVVEEEEQGLGDVGVIVRFGEWVPSGEGLGRGSMAAVKLKPGLRGRRERCHVT